MSPPPAPGEQAELGARLEVARAAAAGYAAQADGDQPSDWASLSRLLFDALDGLLAAIDLAEQTSRPARRLTTHAVGLRLPPCGACLGTGLNLDPADTAARRHQEQGD